MSAIELRKYISDAPTSPKYRSQSAQYRPTYYRPNSIQSMPPNIQRVYKPRPPSGYATPKAPASPKSVPQKCKFRTYIDPYKQTEVDHSEYLTNAIKAQHQRALQEPDAWTQIKVDDLPNSLNTSHLDALSDDNDERETVDTFSQEDETQTRQPVLYSSQHLYEEHENLQMKPELHLHEKEYVQDQYSRNTPLHVYSQPQSRQQFYVPAKLPEKDVKQLYLEQLNQKREENIKRREEEQNMRAKEWFEEQKARLNKVKINLESRLATSRQEFLSKRTSDLQAKANKRKMAEELNKKRLEAITKREKEREEKENKECIRIREEALKQKMEKQLRLEKAKEELKKKLYEEKKEEDAQKKALMEKRNIALVQLEREQMERDRKFYLEWKEKEKARLEVLRLRKILHEDRTKAIFRESKLFDDDEEEETYISSPFIESPMKNHILQSPMLMAHKFGSSSNFGFTRDSMLSKSDLDDGLEGGSTNDEEILREIHEKWRREILSSPKNVYN